MRSFRWTRAELATPRAGRPFSMRSRSRPTCLQVPGLGACPAAAERQSSAPHLCGGGRGDGQRHKLGGEAQGRQLPRCQLAVHAVEKGIVRGEAIEVGVHAPGAQQPRQRLVKLPVHRTKDAGSRVLLQCILNGTQPVAHHWNMPKEVNFLSYFIFRSQQIVIWAHRRALRLPPAHQ